MKAGVVVDTWKADTFRKHFQRHSLRFTEGSGPTSDTYTFVVEAESKEQIQNDIAPIVQAAYDECAASRKQ